MADATPVRHRPGHQNHCPAKVKYDLRAGAPTLTAFPRTAWLAAARKALTTAPADTFGYTDPRGQPALRQALAGYLARARGVRVTPENMVICSGFTQALGLLSEVLAHVGTPPWPSRRTATTATARSPARPASG